MWGQENELFFINNLGRNRAPHRWGEAGYAERCVLGYIDSLAHRTVWWPKIDIEELERRAYSRLAEVQVT